MKLKNFSSDNLQSEENSRVGMFIKIYCLSAMKLI